MESSSFMVNTCRLPALLLSTDPIDPTQDRMFSLLAGESISIRANKSDDFLFLVKGHIRIDVSERAIILKHNKDSVPGAFGMPGEDVLVNVTAIENSVINHVDSKRLDDLITWVGIAKTLENEPEKLGILSKVLTTRSLVNLPVESVFALISRMNLREVDKGDTIVEQGAEAEHFYILHRGQAEVWSRGLYDDDAQKVNMLKEGDSFGEDALVTGGTRNATVKMATPGTILVGEQKDFLDLIANPSIEEIDADMTNLMMKKEGFQLLDVRYEEEHEESYIEGCKLLPLHELRSRLDELDPNFRYITYCRSGKRSAVAALIMKQRKFNAVSMKGGMNEWPYEARSFY